MKLNEEQEKQRLGLYRAGFSDKEMAKLLSRSKPAICSWRKSRNLPVNKFKKHCVECHSEFTTFRNERIHCRDCKDVKGETFHVLNIARAEFSRLAVKNPKQAREMANQIIKEEGEEFKELLLDGILDVPEEELKRRVILQHHKHLRKQRKRWHSKS